MALANSWTLPSIENCPKKEAVLFQYNTFIINLVLDVLTDLTSKATLTILKT